MDVFATNSLAAFSTISGAPTESTGRSDTAYTTTAINLGSVVIKSPQFINPTTGATVTLTDGWFHFSHSYNGSSNHSIFEIQNSAGTPVVRLFQTTSSTLRADYWNGSAWVTTAATFAEPASFTNNDIDVHVVCGVSGSIDVYLNNELVSTISGLNAAVNNLAFITPKSSISNHYQSQFLVADQSTVGAKVRDLVINANATYTAWTGDYTNIIETGTNDTTMISSSVLGDKETYNAADITLAAGLVVSSMWFSARGRLNTVSPANIKPMVRIGSTDYTGAYNFGGLSSVAFGPSVAAFAVDPSTSAAWGLTNINAAELGFVTAT